MAHVTSLDRHGGKSAVMRPGVLIGRWRLERPLGDGGTSSVWLGLHRTDESERVAVKLIRADQGPHAEARFREEARILQGLKHPGIVQFRQAGVLAQEGLYYLVMEYVEGEDLAHLRQSGALDADWARHFFGELASALDHAHTRGITHRDLKPENVMVRPDGTGCLIDFGIAREEGQARVTREGMLPGTIPYMPPEVFRHGMQLDPHRGDIYALGVMLYETLTGHHAFDVPDGLAGPQQTARIVARKLEQGPLSLPPGSPRDLAEVVAIATHPDPTLRYASMRVFAERLGIRSAAPPPPVRQAHQAASTVWYGDEHANDPPAPTSPSGWGEGPETTFGAPLPTRDEVLADLRAQDPPPAPVQAPPEPAGVAGSRSVVVTPPPPPVLASSQDLPPLPPPVEPGGDPPGEDDRSAQDALRYVLKVAGSFAAVILVVGSLVAWFVMRDDTPPPVARVLVLEFPDDIGEAWFDGDALPIAGGVVELSSVAFGEHRVVLASAVGCVGEGEICKACCACSTETFVVAEGAGPMQLELQAPAPVEVSRMVAIHVDGIDDSSLPISVRVGSEEAELGADGRYGVGPLGAADYPVRVDVGSCGRDDGGCMQSSRCPPGCTSWMGTVSVVCDEGDEAVVTGVVMTEPEPSAPRSEGGQRTPTRRVSVVLDPEDVEEEEARPEPYVFVRAQVIRGGVEEDALQTAMRNLRFQMRTCYIERLRGAEEIIGRAVVDFRVAGNGSVVRNSVSLRHGTGDIKLDSCAMGPVQGARIESGKGGSAAVTVSFELR